MGQTLHVTDGVGLVGTRDARWSGCEQGHRLLLAGWRALARRHADNMMMCALARLEAPSAVTAPAGWSRSPTSNTPPPTSP